jgi:predicted nucleotidyltransferase
MVAMRDIQAFAERVAAEFHPERIILFGSYARGEATPDSDVDMLVIMPFRGKGFRQATKIRLRVDATFPMDLLCRRPAEVRKRLAMGDNFMREILDQGRLLYEGHHG